MGPSPEKNDPAIDQRRRGPAVSLERTNVAPRDGANLVRDQPSLASLIQQGYRHSLAQSRQMSRGDGGDLPSQRSLALARPNNDSSAGSRLRTALESAQRAILDDWEPDDEGLSSITGDGELQPEQPSQRSSRRSGPRKPGVDPPQ